jgi:hypothetical protein
MKAANAPVLRDSQVKPAVASPCPGCGRAIEQNFCAQCGELRREKHDYSLRHFLAQAVEAFTSVDSKIGRTLGTLMRTPGALTAAFMEGLRRPFVQPLQLFLISNVIFFLMNSIAGFNTFTTPLFTHLYRLPYSRMARDVAIPYIAARDIPLSEYAKSFDAAAAIQAKSLIIVMVPIFSLLVMAAYWRARRYYVEHLVFSLHFFSFLLLVTSVMQAVTIFGLRALRGTGLTADSAAVDSYLTLLELLVLATFLYRSVRHLYREPRWLALTKTVLLSIGVGLVLTLYRFILFFVTLYTT